MIIIKINRIITITTLMIMLSSCIDLKLMRENSPATLKVKAAGGISGIKDAEEFIKLGAERIGTSRVVKEFLKNV